MSAGKTHHHAGRCASLCAIVALLAACPKKDESAAPAVADTATVAPTTPAKPDPGVGIPIDASKADDPARLPKAPDHPPAEVSVRVIQVGYAGAQGVSAQRSEADAAKRAAALVAAARKQGADFSDLAARFSDAPDADRTKIFRLAPDAKAPYAEAAFALGLGQVADPVKTPSGYFVVERVEPDEYSTAHILLIYKGAKLAPAVLRTTKKAAKARALKVLKQTLKPDANFPVLAGRWSDSPSKYRGGIIAPLLPGRLLEGFEPYLEAVKQTEPGKVHEKLVETPYGFHIIRRLPLEKILVRHLLISFRDTEGKPKQPRSKREAMALVTSLREKLVGGADFAQLAREHSEDAGSADQGGLLPPFARGEMVPRFEQFAFALKPGGLSDIVETKFGFHIIKRLR